MAISTTIIRPVARGFAYGLQIEVLSVEPIFPIGCTLKAEVRDFAGSQNLAGSLSTEDGSILRVSDTMIEVHIAGATTGQISNATAALDLVRTDVSPDEWLGVQITLPVVKPVTAPGDDA